MNLNLIEFILAALFTKFLVCELRKNLILPLPIFTAVKFVNRTKINGEAE